MADQIRDHVRRARRDPSREHLRELWRAVFLLKAWYFVPARREEGPNRPMVVELDGEPWLPAFTNIRRYRDVAEDIGRTRGDELHYLALSPREAMEQIDRYSNLLEGVIFNLRTDVVFRGPTAALVQCADQFDVWSAPH
ncbi:MAG: hypothetical protein ABEL76_01665 [Bradymonadaceae bacterium]